MPAVAGVLFDLDGVIIDSEELHYQACQQVLAPFGVRVSREEYGREWIGKGRGAEHAVETHALPLTADELRLRRNEVYFRLLRNGVSLMPGVVAALERLSPCFALAVATNSSRQDTIFVLDHLAVSRYFTTVVTRDMYVQPKPAPDAFLTAARALGLPPGRCVVVEDSFKGVIAAARAGCKCVAIPHDFTRSNDFSAANLVVGSLDEVTVELIRRLVGVDPLSQ